MKTIKKIFCCWMLQSHDWTAQSLKGIPPTDAQIKGGISGFWDYAKMYCDRCGKVSDLNHKETNG